MTSGGTATSGSDFTPLTGHVNLNGGITSAIIYVHALNDALPEMPETVTITLQPGINYGVAAPIEATVTILDDDSSNRLRIDNVELTGKRTP